MHYTKDEITNYKNKFNISCKNTYWKKNEYIFVNAFQAENFLLFWQFVCFDIKWWLFVWVGEEIQKCQKIEMTYWKKKYHTYKVWMSLLYYSTFDLPPIIKKVLNDDWKKVQAKWYYMDLTFDEKEFRNMMNY